LRALNAPRASGEAAGLGSGGAGAGNPDISHHKSAEQLAREAEARRQKALANERAFDAELNTAQQAYAKAEEALADTAKANSPWICRHSATGKRLVTRKLTTRYLRGRSARTDGQRLKTLIDMTELDNEELAKRKETCARNR